MSLQNILQRHFYVELIEKRFKPDRSSSGTPCRPSGRCPCRPIRPVPLFPLAGGEAFCRQTGAPGHFASSFSTEFSGCVEKQLCVF